MRWDYQPLGTWAQLNRHIDSVLGLKNTTARVYGGLHHALVEVTVGLTRLFPHKRKIYFLKGANPYFDGPMTGLAMEGFVATPFTLEQLASPQSFVESLDREVLLLVVSEDDPILGRINNLEPLKKALQDKRVFVVSLSHSAYRARPLPSTIERFEVQILSLTPQSSLALLGERAQVGSLVAEGQVWGDEVLLSIDNLKTPVVWDKNKVLNFEKKTPGQCHCPLVNESLRTFDRALLCWEDMDGLAVLDELSKELGISLNPPGQESRLETASLSRWGGVHTMDWLKTLGLNEKQIRGLVAISHELITEDLPKKVQLVRERILKMQLG